MQPPASYTYFGYFTNFALKTHSEAEQPNEPTLHQKWGFKCNKYQFSSLFFFQTKNSKTDIRIELCATIIGRDMGSNHVPKAIRYFF